MYIWRRIDEDKALNNSIYNRINRRTVLTGLAAGCMIGAVTAFSRRAQAQEVAEIGGRKIMTLSDGNLVLPISFLFPNVPEDALKTVLTENNLSTEQLEPTLNLTLIEDGDRKILFDAGSGPHFMPSAGKLGDAMMDAGIDPSDITDVVFTHGHPDHLWGIVDDFDEITFSEAVLHFPRAEWDFWRSEDAVEQMEEARKSFAVGAQNRLALMEDRVELFDPGQELVSGIEVVDTAGHTPGHSSFVVHGDGESLMVVGDALTNKVISFEKPEWPTGSDQDPDKGIETRKMLLDRLANDGMQLIGYHLPGNGIGYAEKAGGAYRFVQS